MIGFAVRKLMESGDYFGQNHVGSASMAGRANSRRNQVWRTAPLFFGFTIYLSQQNCIR
jgi:hypothetical protein